MNNALKISLLLLSWMLLASAWKAESQPDGDGLPPVASPADVLPDTSPAAEILKPDSQADGKNAKLPPSDFFPITVPAPEPDRSTPTPAPGQPFPRKKIQLVCYWAQWCQPCRQQTKILRNMPGDIIEVNIDYPPAWAKNFHPQKVPFICIYADEKLIKTFTGLTDRETLEQAMKGEER
jgi:hypothetical protein